MKTLTLPHVTQIREDGSLCHCLDIAGLPLATIQHLFKQTDAILSAPEHIPQIHRKRIANLFFENSTRTRCSFEIAARQIGAEVLNLDIARSAVEKGESLLDTARNLRAMGVDAFVVRHSVDGAPVELAHQLGVPVINAGDGCRAHPSQALLDMYTIYKRYPDFSKLTVAIVGDILHSRVARSQIEALHKLGVGSLRLIAPKNLLPKETALFKADIYHDMDAGLKDVDVVIMLRLQRERMRTAFIDSEGEYYTAYGLSPARLALAAPNAMVMHPGPVNRGVEMSSEVLDGPQSVVLQQVTNGVAMRTALFSSILSG